MLICTDNYRKVSAHTDLQLESTAVGFGWCCTKPAGQTNRHTHVDKNHNGSKGSKVVADRSEEFHSRPPPEGPAAGTQTGMADLQIQEDPG